MPELPEVETMVRELAAKTQAWRISEVLVHYAPIVASAWESFSSWLVGQDIEAVTRIGKWILFSLTEDRHLLIHLKMTGQFHFDVWPEELGGWPPHCHAAFRLINHAQEPLERTLYYKDTRKFGRLRAFGPGQLNPFLASLNLGPDALIATAQEYRQRLTQAPGSLKAALLDQTVLAGFGNIYADETLIAAHLSPFRKAKTLTIDEATALHTQAQRILNHAIECRGSTVANYQAPEGAGSYQNHHLAYGKAGQPCPFCGRALNKIKVNGRGTVYCPFCQK
ncbi:MAG: bifunctional DNA-formamidopyrimidine glycosylase/DNA-(apurinic or apyrimidinic site) lyase [Deltaproteobacteria bacterium]|jgi:formamidopyrimidine-DNA glycosylase|nr:bifunctional DNA-formamidopyrimidine glycosylase/DNA-(apurinic or apyrimidinic site) lyase [Deltaproteobacteria bacterium]